MSRGGDTGLDAVQGRVKLIAGALGGSASAFILSPFDVIRTRMQIQGTLPESVGTKYHTISGCVRNIWKQEGVRGFYRGYAIASVLVPSFWAIYFPLYETLKPVMHRHLSHSSSTETTETETHSNRINWRGEVVPQAAAAGIAGLIGDIVTYPMWTVRTRLQTNFLHELCQKLVETSAGEHSLKQETKRRGGAQLNLSTSMLSTIAEVYRAGGVPNFYRGLPAALFGTMHTAIQFPIYEVLKVRMNKSLDHQYPSSHEKLRFACAMIGASSVSKLIASLFTYPFELVRSRLQDDRQIGSKPCRYRNSWHAFADIARKESWRGFYSGFGVNLARTLPACAITFTTYELVSHWMSST